MDVNLDSAAGKLTRAVFVLVAVLVAASNTLGQTIDVSLNLDYANNADPNSGGTWELAVKTSGSGLAGLSLGLTDIIVPDPETSVVTPTGTINNGEEAGLVGFTVPFPASGYFSFVAATVGPADLGDEQPWFYGVGSIMDPEGGSPDYPGKDPDTSSIGPQLTTLTNVQNVPWGTDDFMDDPDWQHAAILFIGTFAPGQTPAFYTGNGFVNEGAIFQSVPGTAQELGTKSSFFPVTTVVRDDLGLLVAGDYNEDGFVNLADYSIWRDTLGATVPIGTGADGMPDGVIDSLDYDVWKTNFGTTSASVTLPAGQLASVPEPQSVVAAALAVLLGGLVRCFERVPLRLHLATKSIFVKKP